jgi:hypothetical protein
MIFDQKVRFEQNRNPRLNHCCHTRNLRYILHMKIRRKTWNYDSHVTSSIRRYSLLCPEIEIVAVTISKRDSQKRSEISAKYKFSAATSRHFML